MISYFNIIHINNNNMNTFTQKKLTKEEWEYIEKPCNNNDKFILSFLQKSYNNTSDILYKYINLREFLKIKEKNYDSFIFEKIFLPFILQIENKYSGIFELNNKFSSIKDFNNKKKSKKNTVKKAIAIKINSSIEKITKNINTIIKNIKNETNFNQKENIIEINLFILSLQLIYNIKHKKTFNIQLISFLIKKIYVNYSSFHLNEFFIQWINNTIMYFVDKHIDLQIILNNYSQFVTSNIEKDEITHLYSHQKDLINYYKNKNKTNTGSLIFYTSPTGTGKTMTPICLINDYKIIFICAARHVGLTLANYMVTMGVKVGFAFGCTQTDDIRLHNNAVTDYIEKKAGKKTYKKPDHSNGEKLEILISDIQSYYYAMLYMCSFNKKEDIMLYWDEPTIGLDYKEHPLHEYITNIFKNNKIYNVILSCATLPKIQHVEPFISFFKNKFNNINIEVKEINSHIFQNNISILDQCGNSFTPHELWFYGDDSVMKLNNFIKYYTENKNLQKYLDIEKCIDFIHDVDKHLNKNIFENDYVRQNILPSEFIQIENKHITELYIYLISILNQSDKDILYNHFKTKYKFNIKTKQQVYIVSKDAYTITYGPCLYLTNEYNKLIDVLFKTSEIPEQVIDNLMKTLNKNNELLEIINKNIKNFEDIMQKEFEKENKMGEGKIPANAKKIKELIDSTQSQIRSVSIDNSYIPNFKEHYDKFNHSKSNNHLWSSSIDETNLKKILSIHELEPKFKIMLMIGVGVLHPSLPDDYNEIMKELTKNQQLFTIIADDNYIYGTNYQFSHGYLGKDLDITQEKLVQSMGRIGRKSFNKKYSFRLRNDKLIEKIFLKSNDTTEIDNMNKLFVT